MNKNERGPVIFAGLYTVCIILTIITAQMWQQLSEVDFRGWAALLQAVLSAAAILSAYLLSELKRRSDRAEAVRDTIVAMKSLSHMVENTAAYLFELNIKGKLHKVALGIHRPNIMTFLTPLQGLPISHLPTDEAVRRYLQMLRQMTNLVAAIDTSADRLSGAGDTVKKTYFYDRYDFMFEARTRFLKTIASEPERDRASAVELKERHDPEIPKAPETEAEH